MSTRLCRTLKIVAIAGMAALFAAESAAQSSELPPYKPRQQVAGVIRIWGSPQMDGLLRRYEAGFQTIQPSVHFEDSLKSTVSAVAGVYSGRAEIGLLGREMWPSEAQAFKSVEGHAPTAIEVATGSYDVPKATYALMIFVHPSNPIASLSTTQLGRIFGDAAGQSAIRNWGDLGLKGAWTKRAIHLYGFSTENDKALIFRQMVFKGDARWSCRLREYSNSSGPEAVDAGELILRAVAKDPAGIGISNIHYATGEVKVLPLSNRRNEAPVAPTRSSVASRTYPLTRAVYMVVDRDPEHGVGPAVTEFLRYVLSAQGQHDVLEEGNYLPLTSAVAGKQLRLLEGLEGDVQGEGSFSERVKQVAK